MTAATATIRTSLAAVLNWADVVGIDVSSVSVEASGRVEVFCFAADPVVVYDACTAAGFVMTRSAHDGYGMVSYQRGDRWQDASAVAVTTSAADSLSLHQPIAWSTAR